MTENAESDCGPTKKKFKQSKISFDRAEPVRGVNASVPSRESAPPIANVLRDKIEVSKVVETVTTAITDDHDNHLTHARTHTHTHPHTYVHINK